MSEKEETVNGASLETNEAPQAKTRAEGGVRFHAYGAGTLTTDASGNVTASSDMKPKPNG